MTKALLSVHGLKEVLIAGKGKMEGHFAEAPDDTFGSASWDRHR
jgi:hypothetical protein